MRRTAVHYLAAALAASLAVALCVSARCPANGNTHAVYITSNMGDNIWSFDSQGAYIGEVINKESFPSDVRVDKLRAMRFGPGGHLYVSSARGSYSRVFAVSGNGLLNNTLRQNCTRDYLFTATAQSSSNPFLDHPYDILFHPETKDLYVSNQNSITITRYTYAPGKGGAPAWEPAPNMRPALPGGKPNMTWRQQQREAAADVAGNGDGRLTTGGGGGGGGNARDAEDGLVEDAPEVHAPERIPDNAGLVASGWNGRYYMNSVRGMALSPKLPRALVDGSAPPGMFAMDNSSMAYYLLVCDIATNVVHVFDPESGERLFGLWVPSPVQVIFPSRFYKQAIVTQTATGADVRLFEQPYILVTSKEDAMTYLVRFSSSSVPSTPARTQSGIFTADRHAPSQRMIAVTVPTPLHAGSGIYENEARDVVLVADRNGRRVSSYASPYAYGRTDPSRMSSPSPFLGYFVKRLPDQPEFVLSVVLENQQNIPFCYELASDGRMRYVALCTAAQIWSIALAVVLILVPVVLLYRQGQHCLRERRRRERLRACQGDDGEGSTAGTPVLTDAQAQRAAAAAEQRALLGPAAKPRKHYGTS